MWSMQKVYKGWWPDPPWKQVQSLITPAGCPIQGDHLNWNIEGALYAVPASDLSNPIRKYFYWLVHDLFVYLHTRALARIHITY